MLVERRSYIASHPRVNKRVQQAEEGLPYLHLTYFILWESSILKGKERERNCWGGLLAAGWTTVFKERDKWEISPESTKRVNSLFIFSPHKVSSFQMFPVTTIPPVPALSSGSRATRVTSRVTLLGFHFPSTDMVQIFTLLIICSLCSYWMFLIIVVINCVVAVLCSSLHFPHLTRAAASERWPVFVCLWAKRHWLCCVRLSSQACAVKCRLGVGRISRVPLTGNWPSGGGSRLLIHRINLCLLHLSVNQSLESFFWYKAHMHIPNFCVCVWDVSSPVNTCTLSGSWALKVAPATLCELSSSLQLILLINTLLAAIKTLRVHD